MAVLNSHRRATTKPEAVNAFLVDAIKGFGNTKMDSTVSAMLDGARTSENERAAALAQAFETGAVREIECDAVFAVIGQLPDGDLRDAMAARASAVRKSMRWNAGFGQRMREFKPKERDARFAYAGSLVQNMAANGAIPSRITANNVAAQAPTYAEAAGVLAGFEKQGVVPDESTESVLLAKAIEAGDKAAAERHLTELQGKYVDGRLAKIIEAQARQVDVLGA